MSNRIQALNGLPVQQAVNLIGLNASTTPRERALDEQIAHNTKMLRNGGKRFIGNVVLAAGLATTGLGIAQEVQHKGDTDSVAAVLTTFGGAVVGFVGIGLGVIARDERRRLIAEAPSVTPVDLPIPPQSEAVDNVLYLPQPSPAPQNQ